MGSWTAGMVWALSCFMTQRDSLSPQDSHHPFPYEVLKQSYLNEKREQVHTKFHTCYLMQQKAFFFSWKHRCYTMHQEGLNAMLPIYMLKKYKVCTLTNNPVTLGRQH